MTSRDARFLTVAVSVARTMRDVRSKINVNTLITRAVVGKALEGWAS